MKKVFFICAVLALVIVAGAAGYKTFFAGPASDKTEIPQPENNFVWGVNTSCYNIDGYTAKTAAKAVSTIDNLGVNTVRVFLERVLTLQPFSVNYDQASNDDFIDRLVEDKKDIVLIIDGDIINSAKISNFNQEAAGYQMGAYAAKRYKGKVKYYQLANEVTGTAVKPEDANFHGETFTDSFGFQFSTDRYRSIFGWLKGMQRGIRENDPDAKIVISGHWILYSVIDKLIADGINPDIIGWAWYSDDGMDITARQADQSSQPINLAAKLKSYGLPVWIIETNSKYGSYNEHTDTQDEDYQANFLKNFIPKIIATDQIDGVFVYTLFDMPSSVDNRPENQAHWGLIGVSKNSDGTVTFKPKGAYSVLADLIKRYSN